MHDQYASGPFSRVFFFLTRDGLQTFTYRLESARVNDRGTLLYRISTITRHCAGDPLINTEFIRR